MFRTFPFRHSNGAQVIKISRDIKLSPKWGCCLSAPSFHALSKRDFVCGGWSSPIDADPVAQIDSNRMGSINFTQSHRSSGKVTTRPHGRREVPFGSFPLTIPSSGYWCVCVCVCVCVCKCNSITPLCVTCIKKC